MKLANKVALITGAGSGIGQATARLFASEGASVGVMDFNEAAAIATANAIAAQGGKALAIAGDVSLEADVRRMVEETVARFGRLDVLYNNAGTVNQPMTQMAELSVEDYDRVMAVNARGVYLGIKHAIPHMKREGGSIINTASQAAFMAIIGGASYCASKAAVVGLTRVAALEYAQFKIRVNCICPGIIDSPLISNISAQADINTAAWEINALKRRGLPEEIAKVALFLASDDSSYISGAPFSIDGGMAYG
jgi:meso-butanediol dehydrogenase / (S,S)-butanediol dehydrogenase / diacetyl reductase